MNSSFSRIFQIFALALAVTLLHGLPAAAQESGAITPNTRIGKLTDSLEVAIRTLNETMRKLNAEFASEFKHAIEADRKASKRVMSASGAEYDSAMAELNAAMREMETELNSPNATSLRNSLREVDSEMDLLKKNHPELRLDSMSFGPFHMQKTTLPEIRNPEINIPRIQIPKGVIPKGEGSDMGAYIDTRDNSQLVIDNNGNITSGDILTSRNAVTADGTVSGDFILTSPGDVFVGNLNDPIIASGSLPPLDNTPVVTKHYYSDGHTRYFINNSEVSEPIELNAPVEIWPKR